MGLTQAPPKIVGLSLSALLAVATSGTVASRHGVYLASMLLGSFSSAIKKWRALQGRVRCVYTARPGEAWRGVARLGAAA